MSALRERFGRDVKLAVDANGQWPIAKAEQYLDRLARYDLAYVEQPIAAGDWKAMEALAQNSPTPLMLDESLACPADVERLCASDKKLWAHLKLVKLGGIDPTVAAARQLRAAGVPFMIGQMNEGTLATSAAVQVAYATQPDFAELYGADGLGDDPAEGVRYANGQVEVAFDDGLGVRLDVSKTQLIRSFS